MERKQVEKFMSMASRTLVTILVFLMVFTVVDIEVNKKSPEEIEKILEESRKMRNIMRSTGEANINLPEVWPPKMNSPYPDLELFDQKGQSFKLSDLKGRVILLEYIDVTSPISQAQSGAAIVGPYYAGGISEIDKTALPIADILKKETRGALTLPNEMILELKIIVYGEEGRQGARDDAENWSLHFKQDKSQNVIVAVPVKDIRGKITQSLVGGYQLIDQNLMLRVDSSGALPKHNLRLTLAPLVPKLIR